jgi:hypothetical protein
MPGQGLVSLHHRRAVRRLPPCEPYAGERESGTCCRCRPIGGRAGIGRRAGRSLLVRRRALVHAASVRSVPPVRPGGGGGARDRRCDGAVDRPPGCSCTCACCGTTPSSFPRMTAEVQSEGGAGLVWPAIRAWSGWTDSAMVLPHSQHCHAVLSGRVTCTVRCQRGTGSRQGRHTP